jgi:hypothetical protein
LVVGFLILTGMQQNALFYPSLLTLVQALAFSSRSSRSAIYAKCLILRAQETSYVILGARLSTQHTTTPLTVLPDIIQAISTTLLLLVRRHYLNTMGSHQGIPVMDGKTCRRRIVMRRVVGLVVRGM